MTRHFIAASIIAVVLSACGGGHDDARPAPTVVAPVPTAAAPAPSTAAARPPEIKPAQAVAPEPAPAASPVVTPSLHAPMYSSCEIAQGQKVCRHTSAIPSNYDVDVPIPPWPVSIGQSVRNAASTAGAIVVIRNAFGAPERELAYSWTADGVAWAPWRFALLDDVNSLAIKAMPTKAFFVDENKSIVIHADALQLPTPPLRTIWIYRLPLAIGTIVSADMRILPDNDPCVNAASYRDTAVFCFGLID